MNPFLSLFLDFYVSRKKKKTSLIQTDDFFKVSGGSIFQRNYCQLIFFGSSDKQFF